LIAQQFNWRVSFWLLGALGLLFSVPLSRFFRTLPPEFQNTGGEGTHAAGATAFLHLFRIPTLVALTIFVSIATFALYLVYTWLPAFLFDKFHLGLARAGFEASVYPQIGTLSGLFVGGWLADHYAVRVAAARFWILVIAAAGAAPCIYWLGAGETLGIARAAAMLFGFFAGFVAANQAAASFEIVPASLRASTIGVLNLVGSGVSGFGPFLGGIARRTIGVDRLMAFTAVLYAAAGVVVLFGMLRYFAKDRAKATAPLLYGIFEGRCA
jgi:predicted MFS family arabinose efflux permease